MKKRCPICNGVFDHRDAYVDYPDQCAACTEAIEREVQPLRFRLDQYRLMRELQNRHQQGIQVA